MSSFIALMRQDVVMAWRENSAGLSISFFMIAVALIPFGLGPDLKLLRDIAPGLVWVALLLAVLLSLESIFQADLEDGSFDQYLLSDCPLEILLLAKGVAHWLGIVLPLVLTAPLAGILLNIDTPILLPVCLILFAGSPAMSFLGMMGSALAAGVLPFADTQTPIHLLPLPQRRSCAGGLVVQDIFSVAEEHKELRRVRGINGSRVA